MSTPLALPRALMTCPGPTRFQTAPLGHAAFIATLGRQAKLHRGRGAGAALKRAAAVIEQLLPFVQAASRRKVPQ